MESGRGRLIRATQKAKSEAFELINRTKPNGTTNAFAALRRAMQIKDSSGEGPKLIYFLTDGLDLKGENTAGFASRVEHLRRRTAPAAKINTIGFWTQPRDKIILRQIALRSDGGFVNISSD